VAVKGRSVGPEAAEVRRERDGHDPGGE